MMREATISKVRWRGAVWHRVRGWVHGKRKILGIYRTEDEALVCKLGFDARQARDQKPQELTLERWVEEWLDGRKAKGKRGERSSRAVWKAYVVGSKLGAMALRSVRTEHVQAWLDALEQRKATRGKNIGKPLGERTLRNAKNLLGAAYRDAIKVGKVRANVARAAQIESDGSTEDEWTYLTLEEIEQLLSYPMLDTIRRRNTGVRSAFIVAIYAGLREGELWGLRWDDVHLDANPRVTVRYSFDGPTKTGRIRIVPLLPPAVEALKAWRGYKGARKLKGLVWPGKGGKMAAHGHDAGWSRIRAEAGMRKAIRFHDLRHTCASHLVSGSWGRAWRLEEVCEILGHKDLKTTMRYAHLSPESIMGAAEQARAQWVTGGLPPFNRP